MCNIYSSVEIISTNIQNEFVYICDTFDQNAIIAVTTPNSSRYVKLNEHIICFDNFSDKTGQEIA